MRSIPATTRSRFSQSPPMARSRSSGSSPAGSFRSAWPSVRDLLYALNAGSVAGGVNNIVGFRVGPMGSSSPFPDRPDRCSARRRARPQIAFSLDGDMLVVTERNRT